MLTTCVFVLLLWQRGCLLAKFKNNLDFKVNTLCSCQDGLMHSLVAGRPYVLVFKTTNWCWNKCPHCCESSDPNNPKTFIPESVIKGYIKQAASDERFSHSVVFTGGEITSAYKFVDRHYVPNILNYALNNGCGVDIKTNAGWVNAPLATQIYTDIENIVKKHAPKIKDRSGVKQEIPLQVSLSLDRFHKDSLDRDFKFIEHFAKTDMGASFRIHISSFDADNKMLPELLQRLNTAGVNVRDAVILNKNAQTVSPVYYLNNNIIVQYGNGDLFYGGRAKNIKNAYHVPAPQFSFLTADFDCLVAFDTNSRVTLGENCGPKIAVIYNDKDGNPYPLQSILNCLVETTYRAECQYRKQHWFLDGQVLLARKINKLLGR